MNEIRFGDCRKSMRQFISAGIRAQTCVTSPPYYGLRDYGADGQLGLEETPEEYIASMVEVFRLVRDVLTDDGTLWLNLGDSYYNYRPGRGQALAKQSCSATIQDLPQTCARRGNRLNGLKEKDLIGIPWRLAFALQADGWYLRQDIIWHKPNPMPESVRDRCTKAHEYMFLLSKSKDYFFDNGAIREPVTSSKGNAKTFRGGGTYTGGASFNNHKSAERKTHGNEPNADGLRNKRSVWAVATKPYRGAHFATYPPELIEPCILREVAPVIPCLTPLWAAVLPRV